MSLCFKMLRMSTGHMEGDLQPLYLLLTDCYIYLLKKGEWIKQHKKQKYEADVPLFCQIRVFNVQLNLIDIHMNWSTDICINFFFILFSGAAEKPYTVDEAVSYNELDYISVSYINFLSHVVFRIQVLGFL